MPCKITWKLPKIYWEFSGKATAEEFFNAALVVQGDPRFIQSRYSILNFLAVVEADVNILEIVKHAAHDKTIAESNQNHKLAVVTVQPHLIEMAKIYKWEMAGLDWVVEIFSTLEEADAWIVLDTGPSL